MNLFIADDSPDNAMRQWKDILAPVEFKLCGRWSDLESCAARDVIIVHGAGMSALELLGTTASERGIYVIVVSGSGFQRRSANPNVYFRRAPVMPRALGPDPHLGMCIRSFLRALEEQHVEWSRVEPAAFAGEAHALSLLVSAWLSAPERRARIEQEWQDLPVALREHWILPVLEFASSEPEGGGTGAGLLCPDLFRNLDADSGETLLHLLIRCVESSYDCS